MEGFASVLVLTSSFSKFCDIYRSLIHSTLEPDTQFQSSWQ